MYPARQRWFPTATQMSNEPTYVDGGENPAQKKIYYHSGLDIGGAEGLIDIVAATDGLVVSSGLDAMPEHKTGTPAQPRYDVVYVLDERGWYYRYSHLFSIDDAIKPGARVKMGQKTSWGTTTMAMICSKLPGTNSCRRPVRGCRMRTSDETS